MPATTDSDVSSTSELARLELAQLRPLNARSLVLSVLLGSHPPRLSAAKLVRLGALFNIAPGTIRTALSRAVNNGELSLADGRYRLVGSMLERQRAQDLGRTAPNQADAWTGEWSTVFALQTGRSLTERRAFRAALTNQRLGELRPDIWMRPANLAPAPPVDGALAIIGPLRGGSDAELVGQLWDLPTLDSVARILLDRCQQQLDELDWDSAEAIVPSFQLAATILRFLRREPLLPAELQPPGWPIDDLRRRYAELEDRHQHAIGRFLASEQRTEATTKTPPTPSETPTDIPVDAASDAASDELGKMRPIV